MTTGNAAPVHPRLTTKQTPDSDLIQLFIAKNGVTKPTTAQERRAARKEERARGLLAHLSVTIHAAFPQLPKIAIVQPQREVG